MEKGRRKIKPSVSGVLPIVQELREGEELNKNRVGAIADGLNLLFEKLTAKWSKRFIVPGSVVLFDDREEYDSDDFFTTYLCFRKYEAGWKITIEEEHCRDSEGLHREVTPISSAPLETRMRAVEKIGGLEKNLITGQRRRAGELVEAFDTLQKFVEGEDGKESSNGDV